MDRALEASGDDYNVYIPYDMACERLGMKEISRQIRQKQVRVLEQQLESVPDDVRARIILSNAYAYFGNEDGAARELKRAVALRPEDPNVLYNAACSFALLKKGGSAGTSQEGLGCGLRQSRLGGAGPRLGVLAR